MESRTKQSKINFLLFEIHVFNVCLITIKRFLPDKTQSFIPQELLAHSQLQILYPNVNSVSCKKKDKNESVRMRKIVLTSTFWNWELTFE